MSESTAVTTVDRKLSPIEKLFTGETARAHIEPFLPKGADIQRVAASVMLAVKNDDTGKLGQCTPESLVLGVARIQQWGLELGTTAYLIPFKGKATPVAGYMGLVELILASRVVRNITAREVREKDQFSFEYGTNAFLKHIPLGVGRREQEKRGPIVAAYCIIDLPFNRQAFEVMSAEDIDAIRKEYSKQWKAGPLPAWYAKKTVIRQAAKLLPKNPALQQFFTVLDGDREAEIGDATINGATAQRIGAGDEHDERPVAETDGVDDDANDDRWMDR